MSFALDTWLLQFTLYAIATNGNTASFLRDLIVVMLVCYGFFTAVFYELGGLIGATKPRSDDHDKDNDSHHVDSGE